jgi:hypothetical protein
MRPRTLDALKPWILEQSRTDAGKAALTACGFGGVEEKHRGGDGGTCGEAKAQAAGRASASQVRRPSAQATPTT